MTTTTTEGDAVAAILGPDLAAVRESCLGLLPELDRITEGRAEEDELSDELFDVLAGAPHGLLDPTAADPSAGYGIRVGTVASEALGTGRQTYLVPVLIAALSRMPLLLAGTPAQQERYLGNLGKGARASFAMSEPEAGSDVSGLRTTARRDGDGYVLNGAKRWISKTGELEWLIVFARPEGATGHAVSCFVVDGRAEGLTFTPNEHLLGMRAVPLCDVTLDDVRVPADALLGEEGRAFGLAMRALNTVRPIVAARGLGLTAKVIMAATRHVEERQAFGGTLMDQQLVRTKLGGLAARLEAARLLAYRAAAMVDAGEVGKEAAPVLAAAKLLGTELAVDAATTCLHLAGAAGYDERMPFARELRDAQQLTIVEGVSEVQLELIARGLIDRTLWWEGGR
jgi:hypothetical protein